MKNRFCNRLVSAALLSLCLASTANAAVVFDGFGPGLSFLQPRVVSAQNTDVVISGVVVAQDSDWAMRFTPASSHTLDAILLALSYGDGANEVDIYLRASSAGLPGGLIESWHLSNQLVPEGSVFTFTSALAPVLNAGTQYWVEMSAGTEGSASPSRTGWNTASGASSPRARQFDEGNWQASATDQMGMRVLGTPVNPVPEPEALTLLAMGLAVLAWTGRRRLS